MAKFIRLTETNYNQPALVNVDNILTMDQIDANTVNISFGGYQRNVRGTLDEILALIQGNNTVEAVAPATTSTTTASNAPAPGRVMLDAQALIQEEFKYDADTEREVKLSNDSVYLIFSKYSSSKLKMASNIRDGKPVLEGTRGNGWAYYARITNGQLVESDGEEVPGSREDKIRNVLNKLFELYSK